MNNLSYSLPRAPTADPSRWTIADITVGMSTWDRVRYVLAGATEPMSMAELRRHLPDITINSLSFAVNSRPGIVERTGENHRFYRYALKP